MEQSTPTKDADSVERLQAECRRLAEALVLAERDRQLLGYEIHDGVIQGLTAAAMLLEAAGRQATFASPELHSSYLGGVRLLQEAIAEARRVIRGIAAVETDDRGLVESLTRLAKKFRADRALAVKFTSDVDDVHLPLSMQHLLLRIVQESLYNVWKHAQATEAELRLTRHDEELELSIADNGVGFDPARVPADRCGLEGMKARARVLEADLLLDTTPGKGTRVVVRFTPPAV